MKELVIISGKGGTGKTSVTAALADLADKVVLVDCDVDAADLHLILRPEIRETHEFISGREAIIAENHCVTCGRCQSLCVFDAVRKDETGKFHVDPTACEGCGVCVRFCPVHAIDFPERLCGEWYVSTTRRGSMVHARMTPGAENSGKLVSTVRKAARQIAEEQRVELLLADGPPGISCPVIASVTGADAVLVVTEPTMAGEHDLVRVLGLVRHFGIKAMVCVNKWDLNPDAAERIEALVIKTEAVPVGRLPYDKIFTTAQVAGKSVVDYPESSAAQAVKQLWEKICRTM